MGGWMSYNRVRDRNHLPRTPEGDHAYLTPEEIKDLRLEQRQALISGDLNRMEQDYLQPRDPELWLKYGPNPAERCANVTGVDVETVRKVLRYVFLDQT